MGIIQTQYKRAERFNFGFCNACERYACGESLEVLRAEPARDAVCASLAEREWVVLGVLAAIDGLRGDLDAALVSAVRAGVSQSLRDSYRDLVLSA